MSEIHARKTVSSMAAASAVNAGSAPPVAARAARGFESLSGEHSGIKTLSWDELALSRDLDAETTNFKVPPELIELARAAGEGRGRVEMNTPLAPKPTDEVLVVVPRAPATMALAEALAADAAPSVPVEELTAAPSDVGSPESLLAPSRLRAYTPFFVGTALVGGYVALCYFANALIASLP